MAELADFLLIKNNRHLAFFFLNVLYLYRKENNMKKIDKKKFVETVKDSQTMAKACATLDMHFNTFKKYAIEFGVYVPNQGAKGTIKKSVCKMLLNDIISGKYPHAHRGNLKKRLLKTGIKKNECEKCGQKSEWNGDILSMHLHHKDGNGRNNLLENLEMICPNCHSQTKSWCSRNHGGKKFEFV